MLQKDSQSTIIKAYKTYRVRVWFVSNSERASIVEIGISDRVITPTEENKVLALLAVSLSKSLLEYVGSKEYKDLCNG